MRFLENVNINFIDKRKKAFLISGILIIASIISLWVKGGPNLGIDFTGGALVQLKFDKSIEMEEMRTILNQANLGNAEIQNFPVDNVIIIRVKKSEVPAGTVYNKITQIFKDKLPDNKFTLERNEMVGPVVSKDLIKKALLAIIFSSVGILFYVTWRFKGGIWGVAGIIALIHDVFITLGIFSFFNKEISLTVVAALLTLAGYSINDTIVIYDRIRENLRLRKKQKLGQLINYSLNSVFPRTIITSFTTLFVLLALFFKGGKVIHDFSFALLIGVIIGTYSSIFVASPIVYERMNKEHKIRRY